LQLEFEFAKAVTTPPPDFSDCLQFDPEQRTAKAAAARKRESPYCLLNSYIADLNGYRVTQDMLRHPSGTKLTELIMPGTVLRTSYGIGIYTVKKVLPQEDYGVQTYSLVCRNPYGGSGDYYLNELVAVDGKILKLFLASDEEFFIIDELPTPVGYLF
jgi:hypothetical protein